MIERTEASPRYDTIGVGYAARRAPDPRIARQIGTALGDARTVVNIGAGTGNYEPSDRFVASIEPSARMLAQRTDRRHAVCGVAEALPFPDGAFDATMATLTLHHWADLDSGLREMQRVARRHVVLLFDTMYTTNAWIVAFYPEMLDLDTEQAAPSAAYVAEALGAHTIEPVMVPRDCSDGFAGAYWARPEAYLDPVIQSGMSSFAQLEPSVRAVGDERLRAALESGDWDREYGHLRDLDEFDLGYRLVVAR